MSHLILTRTKATTTIDTTRIVQNRFETVLVTFGLTAVVAALAAMYLTGPWADDLLRHDAIASIIWDVYRVAQLGGYIPTALLIWVSGIVAVTVGFVARHFLARR